MLTENGSNQLVIKCVLKDVVGRAAPHITVLMVCVVHRGVLQVGVAHHPNLCALVGHIAVQLINQRYVDSTAVNRNMPVAMTNYVVVTKT